MANGVYAKAAQHYLDGTRPWSGNIKVVLIDTTLYTVDLVGHEFLSDIPSGARAATSGNLTTVTALLDGIADADDVTFLSVPAGPQLNALAAYTDTGSAATSNLHLYFDTLSGFPVIPNGTNVVLTWSNSATRIFQI